MFSQSASLRTYSSSGFSLCTLSMIIWRKVMISGGFSGKNSVIFATRERTDLIPLDSILACFTRNASPTTERSVFHSSVPWLTIRGPETYWAFPEIFLPSARMSFRPESSAGTPIFIRTLITGWVNLRKLWKFPGEFGAIKEKFRFPRSW